MAKLPATVLGQAEVRNHLGVDKWSVGNLNEAADNPWSFYGPNKPIANAVTKAIENQIDTTTFKFGDFRYYDKDSAIGTSGGNISLDLYQGTHDGPADTIQPEFHVEMRELNFKRLNSSINSIIVQLYTDSGYSSPLGLPYVHTIVEDTMSPAPPPGHTVTQTKFMQTGFNNNWPKPTITNPWSYSMLYAEIFLSDAAVNDDYGHTADWQVEITMNQIYKPRVTSVGGNITGDDGGYDFADIFLGFTGGNMLDGATSFNFTAQPYLYIPTGNPTWNPAFWPIIGQFDFSYDYASVERVISANQVNAGPLGEMTITGDLYNAGDGTDTLAWGDERIIHLNIDTFSGLGQEMQNNPPNISP
jgi:hypothetical protein